MEDLTRLHYTGRLLVLNKEMVVAGDSGTGKNLSLLRYGINYSRKNLFSTGPGKVIFQPCLIFTRICVRASVTIVKSLITLVPGRSRTQWGGWR